MSQTRRLAAILAADVAGYSRLMGADEETALNYPVASCRILALLVSARYSLTYPP
jgi:class 3 adenylate cyclase